MIFNVKNNYSSQSTCNINGDNLYDNSPYKNCMSKEDVSLIRESIECYTKGHISADLTLVIINSIVNPAIPSKKDIAWGNKIVKKFKQNNNMNY